MYGILLPNVLAVVLLQCATCRNIVSSTQRDLTFPLPTTLDFDDKVYRQAIYDGYDDKEESHRTPKQFARFLKRIWERRSKMMPFLDKFNNKRQGGDLLQIRSNDTAKRQWVPQTDKKKQHSGGNVNGKGLWGRSLPERQRLMERNESEMQKEILMMLIHGLE